MSWPHLRIPFCADHRSRGWLRSGLGGARERRLAKPSRDTHTHAQFARTTGAHLSRWQASWAGMRKALGGRARDDDGQQVAAAAAACVWTRAARICARPPAAAPRLRPAPVPRASCAHPHRHHHPDTRACLLAGLVRHPNAPSERFGAPHST